MIKVNLLPPEYRKVDGTPVARLVAILVGVFVVTASMGGWSWYHFGVLNQVRHEREQLDEKLVQVTRLADRSKALQREYKEYLKRRQTIEQIGAQRVLWSKKLDQLADLIHNKGDSSRHLIWLKSLSAESGKRGRLAMSGFSGGKDYARVGDFNQDLRDDEEFFQDFASIDPPTGSRVQFPGEKRPSEGWEFPLSLSLKPKK